MSWKCIADAESNGQKPRCVKSLGALAMIIDAIRELGTRDQDKRTPGDVPGDQASVVDQP